MNTSPSTADGTDTTANVETTRCDQRYRIFKNYKDSFGENFDKLRFLNYRTGEIDIPGSALRDAQTGCELYEMMGWNHAEHNSSGPYRCGCSQFDEQLQFVSESGVPLSNIDYRLSLHEGRSVEGRTDNDGKTKRIKSANGPIAIVKAEFFVPDEMPRCPGKKCQPGKSEETAKTIEVEEIETNEEQVGSSLRTVTVRVKSRPLTAGEIEMARLIFKDSVDYSSVKIHNEEYLPFGLQDNNTAMTPNGSMYFNPGHYVQDFSAENDGVKMWFIHEMTHVWQYQLGYSVTWHGFWLAVTGGYVGGRAYRIDTADRSKRFPDLNMEQQAVVIEQFFGGKYLMDQRYCHHLPFYQLVLSEFLRSPGNAALLPK